MDIKEFAKSISGKEYGYQQFTKEEIETAKENGFVIVYGVSDNLIEFEGTMSEEFARFKGGDAWFNKNGIRVPGVANPYKNRITAVWRGGEKDKDGQEIKWIYETEIPHENFMIYRDGKPYCKGIVFNVNDVE